MATAVKYKTINDFLDLPEDSRAELIDGQIVYKAMASGTHANIEGAISGLARSLFHKTKKKNGQGGWWILPEVSVHFRKFERILTPDITGWRREILPNCPTAYPVPDRPDWVCEVSHTTYKKDSTIVFETLQREGVSFYWIANTDTRNLQVFELVDGRYVMAQSLFEDDGWQKVRPFESVQMHMGMLFGADEPEDPDSDPE